jgi:hypothetical protein
MTDDTAPKKRTREAVPYQLREWSRRAGLVSQALEIMKTGASLNAAALQLRTPKTSLWMYVCGFRKLGVAGLMPGISTGRRRSADKLALTDAEAAAIAALAFRVIRREDIVAGCRAYAARPDCRPELRAILTGRLPLSVRAAVRARIPKTAE